MKTNAEKLRVLSRIACLKRDIELQKLARLERLCSVTRSKLEALGEVVTVPAVDIISATKADFHDLWRHRKRMELNLLLARQTAEKLTQQETAAQAFGRAKAVERLINQKN